MGAGAATNYDEIYAGVKTVKNVIKSPALPVGLFYWPFLQERLIFTGNYLDNDYY